MKSLEELVEVAKRRSIGFFISIVILAYFMSLTSNSVWVNIPVAILLISLLRFLSFELEVHRKSFIPQAPPHLYHLRRRRVSTNGHVFPSGAVSRKTKKIDAPAVEAALDEFARCLVHELIVDLWYSSITSDQEAPDELRVILNEFMGEIAQRAKRVNLIILLTRDVVDLVRNHLELYRKVQAQIGVKVLDTCSSEERDEKLKKVLASSGELHPAIVSPEAETQVLQRLVSGILAVVLRPQDAQCKLLRCFARELLACSVLRPIMNFASPGFINDLIEQSAYKSKDSSKNKKNPRSDSSSLRGHGDIHVSSKDDNLSGLEMTEVPLAVLETALSADSLEGMESAHGMKSSSAIVEPREGALKSGKPRVGLIGEHETDHSSMSYAEGVPGVNKQLSDDYAIFHGVSEGDWAHVLELVSQRKTQALAPEHLDNLWAKGRNYKKREIMKSLKRAAELETLSTAGYKGPLSKPFPPKHNQRVKGSAGKETIAGASLGEGSRLTASEYLSSYIRPEKLETDKPHDNVMDLQEESRKRLAAENDQPSTLQGAYEPQVSGSDHAMEPYRLHHPLESYEAPQKFDLSGRDLRISSQLRRTKSSDSGMDDWHQHGKQTEEPRSQHLEISTENVSTNRDVASTYSSSRMIDVPFTRKLHCQVIGAHFEKNNSKAFAAYSISVTDSEGGSWIVQRRYRNFEQLHRRLKDMPNYSMSLPPKRFLSSNLDNAFVRERCILLDKYLKDLLSIPSISELHEVWDFLSSNSKNYAFGNSNSIMKTLAVNVDDAMDDMVRQIKGVSEDFQGAIKQATNGLKKRVHGTKTQESATSSLVRSPVVLPTVVPSESNFGCGGSLDHETDEEEEKFTGRRVEANFYPQASESSGWHSDSELQGERIQSSTKAFSTFEAADYSKGGFYSERRVDASVAEEFSPVNSVAGSDIIEDELAIPQEWSPPKLSVPLLNLVDTVFQLEGRGWIRRQVFWIAKQILQLGMGDAIDDWILAKIQWLRREEVIVSGVKLVQKALWPEGIFIIKHPKYQMLPASTGDRKGTKMPSFGQKLEAARQAMVVREILLEHAPAPLVSLIGRKQYHRCIKDIYYFLQSAVCVKQLAYSLLEMLIIASFPELHELMVDMRSG